MKLRRNTLVAIAKIILLLAGFASGLFAGMSDSSAPTVVEGVIIALITILTMPLLIMLLFRVSVAIGVFKPPWEVPTRVGKLTPLSSVQLGSFVFAAMGVGATVSLAWRGLMANGYILLGFAGGLACHLALVRLRKRFSSPQGNMQDSTSVVSR
jgi:hypothetical protein